MAKAIKLIMIIAIVGLLMLLPTLGLKIAKADDVAVTEFDKTYVTDDLNQMTLDGVKFDELDYPVNLNNHKVTLLNFIEYMFTYDEVNRDKYGVYLYFYNPSQKDIIASASNKIQIADAFDSDGNATSYKKFNLQLINASTAPAEKVFLKFKVVFDKSFIKSLNKNARRYKVSGVELFERNKQNATEYNVSGGWTFTGYAKGCGRNGQNSESTLQIAEYTTLESISLDVRETFYRQKNVSSLGAGHQNELNSVYFAVPNKYLNKYGNLQKIKCEYYEYKTMPIIMQPWQEAYQFYYELSQNKELIGKLPRYQTHNRVQNTYKDTSVLKYELQSKEHDKWYDPDKDVLYSTKKEKNPNSIYHPKYNEWIHRLIFDHEKVSKEELKEYIYNYSTSYITGNVDIKDGRLSNDLFSAKVDSGHKRGYNLVELDANDKFNMLSYDSNHSWWDKFWTYGFWAPDTSGDIKNIRAIEMITEDVLSKATSDSIYVDSADMTNFKNFCNESYSAGKTPFLFRFAVNDYYSSKTTVATGVKTEFDVEAPITKDSGSVAQQTLYLDFDIITLTFQVDGVYTVVPVVSDPIDLIKEVTPPLEEKPWIADSIAQAFKNAFNAQWFTNWGRWVLVALAVVIGIVLIVVFFPVIVAVVKIIGRVFIVPFKAMKKTADNRNRRRKRAKITHKKKKNIRRKANAKIKNSKESTKGG